LREKDRKRRKEMEREKGHREKREREKEPQRTPPPYFFLLIQALHHVLDMDKLLVKSERLGIKQRATGLDLLARHDLFNREFDFFQIDRRLWLFR
jgi:hypothetical protein